MSKENFRDSLHLNKDNIQKLAIINEIIDEYAKQNYKLTLRQLYYQLVSRDIIPNRQNEYAKLGNILVKGRMSGMVDWDAIEDRLRIPKIPYWVAGISGALDDTMQQYRLDRQSGQPNYIELWVEKDALSNVLYRVSSHYHVRLMVNRGYSSCTAIHDAYDRFVFHECNDQVINILYLGDHDPSGLDMIRDITDRLNEFGISPVIQHIALTQKQIKKYDPPPNPAKITDPRARGYISEHGNISWEVDALNPETLHQLVIQSIENLIDKKLFDKQIDRENADKNILSELIDKFDE